MGFCLLNNVAVAAASALAHGAERVAIVDWDVHHGNGTQNAFYRDPRVLFVSLHQYPFYPGTGAPSEIGEGTGLGYTVNLALPAQQGSETYAYAFRRVLLPVLEQFRADLVLVSAGFDAHVRDPLGGMALPTDAYRAMASALLGHVEALGHGRLACVLEGGYDLSALEQSVAGVAGAMLGKRLDLDEGAPSPAGREAVERTARALASHWKI
jgi:acetoin utilization deacetylase AcuC-like enzyme